MRVAIVILFMLVCVMGSAQSGGISERTKNRMEAIRDSHFSMARRLKAEHEAFRKRVLEKWGDSTMVESTKKIWVEYSDDLSSRSRVDFEKGEAVVEVISDKNELQQDVVKRLEESVETLLGSRGKSIDFKSEVAEQKPVTQKPVLDNQVDMSRYGVKNNEISAKDAAKTIVGREKKTIKAVSAPNGEKQISAITIQLAPNHLSERAARFSPYVRQYSKEFSIDEPLIYAIMEQESSFNPMARSSVAYGLMQLVPKYGGKDAYYYVYKIKDEPTPEFLYVPDNNIRLGTAYIRILMAGNFSKINDKINLMLCTIAAYNTGAGNVARSFTGSNNVNSLVTGKINSMSNKELYDHLRYNLHHSETRDYIQKVTSKMKKYVK